MSTKRYSLFAGRVFYPDGGSQEFRGFGTVEELKKLYETSYPLWAQEYSFRGSWGHVCDHDTMKVVSVAVHGPDGVRWVEMPSKKDLKNIPCVGSGVEYVNTPRGNPLTPQSE